MKQIAWDEVMKRLEVASKICNDASPVQVEGPIHVGVDLGTADVVVMAVDDNGMPVSAFLEWATVVRDGVVVDYHGAITIVKRLVSMTEERLGRKITEASTSYPPGTDARLSIKHSGRRQPAPCEHGGRAELSRASGQARSRRGRGHRRRHDRYGGHLQRQGHRLR